MLLQVIRMVGESQETVSVGGGSGSSSNKMPTLEEYGTNLTTQATEVRPSAEDTLMMLSMHASDINLDMPTHIYLDH